VGTSNDACHLVGHIQSDSRKLKAGDVFIAVAGTQVHGAMFAPAAKAGGAWVISDQSADGVDLVVADLQARLGDFLNWYYDYPSQQLQLIGITGTNGKTSTSHYVAQWLAALDVSVAVMGTVGNGIWGQLSAATHTTPDAPSVYRQLAQWRDDGVRVVVMEVSSHAIDQQRIIGLSFAVLALTQVTRDHLDYHGSEAHYRAVKKRLFSNWSSQVQVINGDDEVGRQLLPICSNVLSYGQQQDAMMRSQGAFALADGLDVSVRYGAQTWQGKLPLYGQFNVDNVLCALGCVVGLGYLFDAVMPLLSRTQAVAGRMQLVAAQPVVVVDYAHTPDALAKALQALRQHCAHGQIWVVFGAGGNRDTGKRPLMGAVAVLGADRVIVTDDNPRDELPSAIAEEIMSGINKAGAAHYIANRQQAICAAIEGAGAQDVVLIAGKGHEDYQEIAGVRLPFSDVEAVTVCLA
jgi:UDP-N-acetylmuramoyl-L-alanyl-D-glutamate--2,6-diaminopimelate ligase